MRPIDSADARAVRALVDAELGDTPYVAQLRWAIEAVLAGKDAATSVLVALDASHQAPIGLVAFGGVAGAQGATRVLGLVVATDARRRGVGSALCEAAVSALRAAGTRLVVAELPGDPAIAPVRALLRGAGFREEATVPDYFRDGVPLVILRLDLVQK